MEVFENEKHAFFDVDETLVMEQGNIFQPSKGAIPFKCPHTNDTIYLRPNRRHINFLMTQKGRGYDVTVWSQNGWAWAKHVIETLGLVEHVDRVQTKCLKYVDDLPADSWMSRVYLDEKVENNT